jgi:eukaryotic-like serine/threonine-protein kinase
VTETTGEKVLAGRYEITKRLGIGGMAEVFLGRDRVLGRTIAVKTLLSQFSTDPSFIARFRREAQSAAALNHPHIVGVYDTGSDNGTHFIVMEYIPGKTLKDVVREEGPLLPERAAEIAADVCSALQFAHAHGIVHRDVKPANIMIGPRGEVKVADFGIARAVTGETVTHTATVLGTAQYFSPEQAQAAPVDARSDLYSLGVVLYEMLTRQVPFTGSSPVAIAYKHVKEDPIPPSRLNADVPPAVEAIVMKSLAKNPDNRYQSGQEMRVDLERAIKGQPVTATPLLKEHAPADKTAVHRAIPADETIMMRRPVRETPDERARRRGMGIALLVLILFAIAGILLWALLSSLPSNKLVAVPTVTNQTFDVAKVALENKGFVVVRGPDEAHDTVLPGAVIRQSPEAGARVKKGSTVTLIVSTGPSSVKVPDLKGKTQAEAKAKLEEVHLVLGVVRQVPSTTVQKGRVINQNPNPGVLYGKGQKVDVDISSGKPTAVVPDVVGLDEATARERLAARKFTVVVVYEAPGNTCEQPEGNVCRQDPRRYEVRDEGSTVTITVARSEPLLTP